MRPRSSHKLVSGKAPRYCTPGRMPLHLLGQPARPAPKDHVRCLPRPASSFLPGAPPLAVSPAPPSNRTCILQPQLGLREARGAPLCLSSTPVFRVISGPTGQGCSQWAQCAHGEGLPLAVRVPPGTFATSARTTFPRGSCCGGHSYFRRCLLRALRGGELGGCCRGGAGVESLEAGCALGGRLCPRFSGDMRGAARASVSAGPRVLGCPARRGVPHTNPGAGRGRIAATQASFVRRGRGRPHSKNGLTSKGQRRAMTTGPENRGESDRWLCGSQGRIHSSQGEGTRRPSGKGPLEAQVLVNGVPRLLVWWVKGIQKSRSRT